MAVVVLHSTEGSSLDGAVATLRRNNTMSHEVIDVREREIVQLVAYDAPARSLRNLAGGVETNRRGGVVQVEIVGFASRSTAEAAGRPGGPIMPELDDDELTWLGTHLRWLCARVGAPFEFPCPFKPYPASYGNNGVRLSPAAWLRVEGVIGHMHVPENSHGDPGALDVHRMAALSAPAPFVAASIDYGGIDMDKVHTKLVEVRLDGGGNGWRDVPFGQPVARIVGVVPNGGFPPENGYGPIPRVAAQMRGDVVIVTATGGPANGSIHVWVSAA